MSIGFGTGDVLGDRFRIVGELGRGGMATVFLCVDQIRSERVALKILHPHLAGHPGMRKRLIREVQSASRIRHPRALVAHDVHELGGLVGLSMPVHPGETLDSHVRRHGPMKVDALHTLAIDLAEVLAASHGAGVIHRDVTPRNVMIDEDGRGSLMDFGLSRLDEGTQTSTAALGTAGYVAPEIYQGRRPDPRVDLYGLGATLYFAAAARPPFDGHSAAAQLRRQLDDDRDALVVHRPDLRGAFCETVETLLAPDPAHRPRSAGEVAEDLREGNAPEVFLPVGPGKSQLHVGTYTVVCRETRSDRVRRREARFQLQLRGVGRWPATLEPERDLAAAVAAETGLPGDALVIPKEMLDPTFLLVQGVPEDTAWRLVAAAIHAGFEAFPVQRGQGGSRFAWTSRTLVGAGAWGLAVMVLVTSLGLGGSALWALQSASIALYAWMTLGILTLLAVLVGGTAGMLSIAFGEARPPLSELPPALFRGLRLTYRHTLYDFFNPVLAGRTAPPVEDHASTGDRAWAELDELDRVIAQRDDLPEIARHDLRATVERLRERTLKLRDLHAHLERELTTLPGPEAGSDIAAVASRLTRYRTLQRSGAPVPAVEMEALERAMARHEQAVEAARPIEHGLVRTQAALLEIAATVARTRRTLIRTPQTGPILVALLEARAADASEAVAEASTDGPRIGDKLGDYALVRRIGRGASATVWLADGPTGQVALKVLHPSLLGEEQAVARFHREARVGVMIDHPNVVRTRAQVTLTLDSVDLPAIVLDPIDGRPASHLLAAGGLPDLRVREIGRQLADGLASMHDLGLLHRDVKPANVRIAADGHATLLDLGIARPVGEALSSPGQFVGSLRYAAPEQLAGRSTTLDARVDLYGLGVTLYALATGHKPFADLDPATALERKHAPLPAASSINDRVTPFLSALLATLTDPHPDRRPASAAVVRDLLHEGEASAWWTEARPTPSTLDLEEPAPAPT